MSIDRITRVNELLRREIGGTLFRVMTEDRFDMSAVTIMRVATSRNLRTARVFVSIRDHANRREEMMRLLRRHRLEIQAEINKNVVLKYTPRLSFVLDTSVEKGDSVLGILADLEEHEAETGETPGQQEETDA